MKLVRKDSSTEVVRRHEAELQAQQLDEQSLLNPNVIHIPYREFSD